MPQHDIMRRAGGRCLCWRLELWLNSSKCLQLFGSPLLSFNTSASQLVPRSPTSLAHRPTVHHQQSGDFTFPTPLCLSSFLTSSHENIAASVFCVAVKLMLPLQIKIMCKRSKAATGSAAIVRWLVTKPIRSIKMDVCEAFWCFLSSGSVLNVTEGKNGEDCSWSKVLRSTLVRGNSFYDKIRYSLISPTTGTFPALQQQSG